MTALFSLLTGIPGFLNGLLAYLNKKQDTAAIFNGNAKDVSIALVQAEVSRQTVGKDILTTAMSHPVWWVAWGLGVFPVLAYYAAIFWVSTFPWWGWTVMKVPTEAQDFARLVVGSMFGIAGVSSVAAGIASAWSKRT